MLRLSWSSFTPVVRLGPSIHDDCVTTDLSNAELKSQRFPSEEYVDTLCHYNYLASLADYFLVDGMNNYILRNMGHFLGEKLNTICNTAICPRDLDCDQRYIEEPSVYPEDKFKELEDDGFPSDLCVSIRQAYAMPCATQHVYVDFIHAARMHTLKNEHVQKLIKDVPAFGCDLLDAMTKGPLSNAFDGNKTFEMWKGVSNPADVLDDNMDPLRAADTWPHLSSLPVESQLPAAFVAGRATTRAAGTPGAHRP